MNDATNDTTKLGAHEPRVPEADRVVVERAIAEAERTTGAEFVVAVAARSGRYDRAEDLFGLVFGLLGVSGAWLLFQGIAPNPTDWETGWTLTLGLPLLLGIFAGWTVLGAALATRVPVLARPFISRVQMEEEVHTRGREAFYMFRVDGTPESPGVLIYVSLLERRVLIATADGIGAKLPAGAFDAARDALIADIRAEREIGESLAAAVQRCAAVVGQVAPPREKRANAIANTVRLLA
jgi:putative membrane protein